MIHNKAFPKRRQKPIRAAVVIPGLGAGGAERSFVTLARHLQGIEIERFVIRTRSTVSEELLAELRSICPVIEFADGDEDFRSKIFINCSRVHVVLTWGLADLAHLRADISDVPFIDVCHTSAVWESVARVMKGSAEGANYLAAVSESARDAYPEEFRDSVRVIHNGIESSRCAPRMGRELVRRSWGIKDDQRVALYCGRFSDEKRPISLIDSLPEDVLLIAAGPDSEKKIEFAQAASSRAPGRTAFVPFSTHVGDLMAAADALVMPSLTEAHPLTMFEAFFARLPVVACDWPFLDEAVPGYPLKWRDLVVAIPVEFTTPQLRDAFDVAAKSRTNDRVLKAHLVTCDHFLADQMAARWELYIEECLRRWNSYAINPPMVINGGTRR